MLVVDWLVCRSIRKGGLRVSSEPEDLSTVYPQTFHIGTPSGERLRQLRLARGMSLDALARAAGGIVTKQALSKYERGASVPSDGVQEKLAEALAIDLAALRRRPALRVEVVEFRKRSKLGKRAQDRVKNLAQFALEERVRLLDLLGEFDEVNAHPNRCAVSSLEEAEKAAEELRSAWNLGGDPIPNMVAVLENRHIHVIEIDAEEGFDGLSLRVTNDDEATVALGVVTRRGVPGGRQRLSLAHELGHLVLSVDSGIDEEKAAFRFGAAFLAPAKSLYRDVGRRRKFVSGHELVLLKRRYGMSMQALLLRMRDLGVINAYTLKRWFMVINKKGWRKQEPHALEPERPEWLRLLVHRALWKGLLSRREAEKMLCLGLGEDTEVTLVEKQEFAKMSNPSRLDLLAKQIEEL